MQITSFNRGNLNQLRDAIDKALQEVTKNLGLQSIKSGNIKFTDQSCNVQLVCTVQGGLTIREQASSDSLATSILKQLGWEIGQKFQGPDGKTFVITGYNTRAKAAPILFQDERGRGYKARESYLKACTKLNLATKK